MVAGEPEIRCSIPASSFNPYPRYQPLICFDVEVVVQLREGFEAFLVACFLRRYVTYFARRRRFAAMQGAAKLLPSLERAP